MFHPQQRISLLPIFCPAGGGQKAASLACSPFFSPQPQASLQELTSLEIWRYVSLFLSLCLILDMKIPCIVLPPCFTYHPFPVYIYTHKSLITYVWECITQFKCTLKGFYVDVLCPLLPRILQWPSPEEHWWLYPGRPSPTSSSLLPLVLYGHAT